MNKETIKNLTALELNCYVCYKPIESFTELQDMLKDGTWASYTDKELSKLYREVNTKVLYIGSRHGRKMLRHEDCNPLNRVKNEEDL